MQVPALNLSLYVTSVTEYPRTHRQVPDLNSSFYVKSVTEYAFTRRSQVPALNAS